MNVYDADINTSSTLEGRRRNSSTVHVEYAGGNMLTKKDEFYLSNLHMPRDFLKKSLGIEDLEEYLKYKKSVFDKLGAKTAAQAGIIYRYKGIDLLTLYHPKLTDTENVYIQMLMAGYTVGQICIYRDQFIKRYTAHTGKVYVTSGRLNDQVVKQAFRIAKGKLRKDNPLLAMYKYVDDCLGIESNKLKEGE